MSSVAAAYLYAQQEKRAALSARSARSSVSMDTPRVSTEAPSTSSTNGSSIRNAVKKAVAAVKEHHRQVNSAFDAVYGTSYYAPQPGNKASVRYTVKN
jgi:hypothetical protein